MLPKKILSLSLAAGLAVSASSNVFAFNGKSDVASSPSATECSIEIMSNITTLLKIRTCVIALSSAVKTIDLPEVQAFCNQLKYVEDVNKLAAAFERLYNSNAKFKEVVDDAWVADITGKKRHATIQGVRQCLTGVDDPLTQTVHGKRFTSIWDEPDKSRVKRNTSIWDDSNKPRAKRNTSIWD